MVELLSLHIINYSVAQCKYAAVWSLPDIKSSSVCVVPAGSSNSSAAVRQKEMTKLYKIHSHAHIQALQARANELGHSNKSMLVNLVSLESVRIARESYALLRPLIKESWIWACPELEILLVVAGLSLEIQKLEHDVLPQLMVQEAKLERGALEALLLMKNSAITLLDLRKCFILALGVLLADEDLVSARVKKLSIMLKDTADDVLNGNRDIVWLQERAPLLVQLVTDVLETPCIVGYDSSSRALRGSGINGRSSEDATSPGALHPSSPLRCAW
uniref:Uncharacterized protein n=3 Tax=Aegilops tauschii subsp. strangulata TaxID=200361 RepID=A0A453JDP9_AEGTS